MDINPSEVTKILKEQIKKFGDKSFNAGADEGLIGAITGRFSRGVLESSGKGLKAVDFKNQEFEIVKENLESTAQEVQKLHLKQDNSENRAVERHQVQLTETKKLRDDFEDLRDEFEKVRALILCAYANDENDWRNNALNGAITKTPLYVQVRRLYELFKSFFFWNPLLVSVQTSNGSNKSTNNAS